MRKLVSIFLVVVMVSISSFCIASNDKNPTGTIVSSELMRNRYELPKPDQKDAHPEAVEKLLKDGTITTVPDVKAK